MRHRLDSMVLFRGQRRNVRETIAVDVTIFSANIKSIGSSAGIADHVAIFRTIAEPDHITNDIVEHC